MREYDKSVKRFNNLLPKGSGQRQTARYVTVFDFHQRTAFAKCGSLDTVLILPVCTFLLTN